MPPLGRKSLGIFPKAQASKARRAFRSGEVCRSVFGKTRSTFESQNQRLRGVKDASPEAHGKYIIRCEEVDS